MPAENEPAEPNALTQSLQLTCSLTPSSTVPSTRLVIIWLKRWLARPLIDRRWNAPVASASGRRWIGEGVASATAMGNRLGDGESEKAMGSRRTCVCADAGRSATATQSESRRERGREMQLG